MEGLLLVVQNESGDVRFEITWDPSNPREVEEVREKFIEYSQKGYIFFESKRKFGFFKTTGDHIDTFDPKKGKMVAKPVNSKENTRESHSATSSDQKSRGESGKRHSYKMQESKDAALSKEKSYSHYDPTVSAPKGDKQYVATRPIQGG